MKKFFILTTIALFVSGCAQWQYSSYYKILDSKCDNDSCCESSVGDMSRGDYYLVDEDNGCPDGFAVNQLRCATSYKWCEPTTSYYKDLRVACNGDNCCESSVGDMQLGGYKLVDENYSCPKGFIINQLECITSYNWCVPDEIFYGQFEVNSDGNNIYSQLKYRDVKTSDADYCDKMCSTVQCQTDQDNPWDIVDGECKCNCIFNWKGQKSDAD